MESQVSNGPLDHFFRNEDRLVESVVSDVVRDQVREMLPRDSSRAPCTSAERLPRASMPTPRDLPVIEPTTYSSSTGSSSASPKGSSCEPQSLQEPDARRYSTRQLAQ